MSSPSKLIKELQNAKPKDLALIQAKLAAYLKLMPVSDTKSKSQEVWQDLYNKTKHLTWRIDKDSHAVLIEGKRGKQLKFVPNPFLFSIDYAFAFARQLTDKDISLVYNAKTKTYTSGKFEHKSACVAVVLATLHQMEKS